MKEIIVTKKCKPGATKYRKGQHLFIGVSVTESEAKKMVDGNMAIDTAPKKETKAKKK